MKRINWRRYAGLIAAVVALIFTVLTFFFPTTYVNFSWTNHYGATPLQPGNVILPIIVGILVQIVVWLFYLRPADRAVRLALRVAAVIFALSVAWSIYIGFISAMLEGNAFAAAFQAVWLIVGPLWGLGISAFIFVPIWAIAAYLNTKEENKKAK